MTGELVPNAEMRMSDRDREGVVSRLHQAVGEGRLTIDEFEERLGGVLAARTFGDIEPYVADLPAPHASAAPAEPAFLTVRGSTLRRTGRWIAPSRINVEASGSRVIFDFTQAVITGPVITIYAALRGAGMHLIVPPDSSVDVGGVSLHGSSVRARRFPNAPSVSGLHFVVTGEIRGSSIKVKPPRVWRWPWQRRH
jgi:hypothetical protein